MKIADLKDTDLISRVRDAHEAVVVAECFNSRDVLMLEHGSRELESRGYTINQSSAIAITKEEN